MKHTYETSTSDIFPSPKCSVVRLAKRSRQAFGCYWTTKCRQGFLWGVTCWKWSILLNKVKILGCEIDRENQVDMILVTLPETFDIVKINYSLEWLTYSLTGPMMGFLLRWFCSTCEYTKSKRRSLLWTRTRVRRSRSLQRLLVLRNPLCLLWGNGEMVSATSVGSVKSCIS